MDVERGGDDAVVAIVVFDVLFCILLMYDEKKKRD